jgi:DNA-binding beta-propeller fold protein YncE
MIGSPPVSDLGGRGRFWALVALALGWGAPPAPAGEAVTALTFVKAIRLPGVKGRIDHLAVDAAGKRLVVAALASDSVEVVDLEKGEVVKRLTGAKEPQGVAILKEKGEIVVAYGGDGSVRFFDPSTLEPAGLVDLGDDADNVRVEAATGRIWVGYGAGSVAAIEKGKKVADVALQGHPESFQLEEKGTRTFVNVPTAGHVAVVDRKTASVVATWPLNDLKANFPMALDEGKKRLYVGCRNPARLLVLDTDTGKQVAVLEISKDVDDVWVDAATGRLYLSCGEGFVDVVTRAEPERYERATRVPTSAGARTSLFVPATGLLYVAVPQAGAQAAEVRIYRTPR